MLAAEQSGDTASALLLGELQMWWEPSWGHLQALSSLCAPQKFGLRRQQLQLLALNDTRCKPEMRFEVLAREGLHAQGTSILIAATRDNHQQAHASLKAALEALGGQFLTQNAAVVDALWSWIEQLVEQGEGVDPAMEWLAGFMAPKVLQLYDKQVEVWHQHCQQSVVNASTKATMRSWLIRARRVYHAAGKGEEWEQRFAELTDTLKRKSSLSAVWADLGPVGAEGAAPQGMVGTPGGMGQGDMQQQQPGQLSGQQSTHHSRPNSIPASPANPR